MTEPMTDERLAHLTAVFVDQDPRDWFAKDGLADIIRELLAEVKRLGSARDSAVRAWKDEHDAADELQRELRKCADLNHDLVNEAADATTHVEAVKRELTEARSALTVAAELIDRLAEDDECDYDHHNKCRSHSLHARPCPHPLGRQFVEFWRAVEAEQKETADDAHQ